MERAYRQLTRVSGVLISALGVTMVAVTLARGGGPLASGVILGVLFALLGAGRAFLARHGT